MPRTARAAHADVCYHVINRGNARNQVFHTPDDYSVFMQLFAKACERHSMRVLSYCLMPNHFHFCLWPRSDRDMAKFMHWLLTTHVVKHHRRHRTSGHIWQGRFKAFPAQSDEHLLIVLRYIERNPVRAKLCALAEDWPWSSARWWRDGGGGIARVGAEMTSGDPSASSGQAVHSNATNEDSPPTSGTVPLPPENGDSPQTAGTVPIFRGPVKRPADWLDFLRVNESELELAQLRASVNKGTPFGSEFYVKLAAPRYGLEHTTRPVGRPRKAT